uniref:non-specific serine/threonine protein kinase n=1 Tax=Plectus sambesii TaxID=2011161 RepID=A0A914WCI4_9BILA
MVKKKPGGMLRRNLDAKNKPKRRRPGKKEFYVSAGPGNQRWLPMERQESASVSKSAVLTDKTSENGGSPDSLNPNGPLQTKNVPMPVLLPPSQAETVTSTPIAFRKPSDKRRVFPELVDPPPNELDVSVIEAEPCDENVPLQPLTASPPLHPSFIAESVQSNSNEKVVISPPDEKSPEVLTAKAAFRRLSLWSMGNRLSKRTNAAVALERLDESASEENSPDRSLRKNGQRAIDRSLNRGDTSNVSSRRALSSEEDFFDDKLQTPHPNNRRKSMAGVALAQQPPNSESEESAFETAAEKKCSSLSPSRTDTSAYSKSQSDAPYSGSANSKKSNNRNSQETSELHDGRHNRDDNSSEDSRQESEQEDSGDEDEDHDDDGESYDNDDEGVLALATSMVSQSSDLSVNATRRNFSRLSVADGASPYYMKGHRNARSPMEDILHVCKQDRLLAWEEAFSERMLAKAKKIGEGVYGEVFRTTNSDGISVALKVIPIEGNELVNDEKQKTFEEMLPEILIANELSEMRGSDGEHSTPNFVQVVSVRVVCGAYPVSLIASWNTYAENKRSENDCPDMFKDNQLFVVFEFGDGGEDLESFKFKTVDEARSVFLQVLLSLAITEEAISFEHRDLHIGNILVSRTTEKMINYRYAGSDIVMHSKGVHVYIIDFTNSRLSKDGCTIFTNLAMDDALFEGPDNEYQFEIYRMMRRANDNDWKSYCPQTNVFWLHYLIDKLIKVKRYKGKKMTNQQATDFLNVNDELLSFDNCSSVISASTALYSWFEAFGISCFDQGFSV